MIDNFFFFFWSFNSMEYAYYLHGIVSDEKNGESIIPSLTSRYIDKFWQSCENNCNIRLTPLRWSKNFFFSPKKTSCDTVPKNPPTKILPKKKKKNYYTFYELKLCLQLLILIQK